MMNQPLRRVDPLGRSVPSTPSRPIDASPDQATHGSAWPISSGSIRAIVDISSTTARTAVDARRLRRRDGAVLPRRSRFICQACSERPSMPCARAHSPALQPLRFAASRYRCASLSSSIFLPTGTRDLHVATEPARRLPTNHPAVADGSRSDARTRVELGTLRNNRESGHQRRHAVGHRLA